MEVQKRRFVAALALFAVWIATLAILAVVSSRRPPAPAPARVGAVSR